MINVPKDYSEYRLSWVSAILLPVLIVIIQQTSLAIYIKLSGVSELVQILPVGSALQVFFYITIIYVVFWRLGYRFPMQMNDSVRVLNLIGIALGCSVVVFMIITPILDFLPQNPNVEKAFEVLTTMPLLAIVMTTVVAPIFEELIFRGLLLGGLSHRYQGTFPLVFSSLLFGVFHLNIQQFISASIIGVICGLIFLWTGSLIYSIIFHSFYNILVSLTSYFILFLDLNIIGKVIAAILGLVFVSMQLYILRTSCN